MCYVPIELPTHQHSNRATLNVVVYECGGYIGFLSGTRLIEMYTRQNPMHDSSHSLAQTHTYTRTARRSDVCVRILRNVKYVLRTILSMSNKSVHIQIGFVYTFIFPLQFETHANEKRCFCFYDAYRDLDRISNSMGLPRAFANSINRFDSHFLAIKFRSSLCFVYGSIKSTQPFPPYSVFMMRIVNLVQLIKIK